MRVKGIKSLGGLLTDLDIPAMFEDFNEVIDMHGPQVGVFRIEEDYFVMVRGTQFRATQRQAYESLIARYISRTESSAFSRS